MSYSIQPVEKFLQTESDLECRLLLLSFSGLRSRLRLPEPAGEVDGGCVTVSSVVVVSDVLVLKIEN